MTETSKKPQTIQRVADLYKSAPADKKAWVPLMMAAYMMGKEESAHTKADKKPA